MVVREALKDRRSYYQLNKDLPIDRTELQNLL